MSPARDTRPSNHSKSERGQRFPGENIDRVICCASRLSVLSRSLLVEQERAVAALLRSGEAGLPEVRLLLLAELLLSGLLRLSYLLLSELRLTGLLLTELRLTGLLLTELRLLPGLLLSELRLLPGLLLSELRLLSGLLLTELRLLSGLLLAKLRLSGLLRLTELRLAGLLRLSSLLTRLRDGLAELRAAGAGLLLPRLL